MRCQSKEAGRLENSSWRESCSSKASLAELSSLVLKSENQTRTKTRPGRSSWHKPIDRLKNVATHGLVALPLETSNNFLRFGVRFHRGLDCIASGPIDKSLIIIGRRGADRGPQNRANETLLTQAANTGDN